MPSSDTDVLLVGGGLANSLIALALRRRRPELRVRLLEAAAGPREQPTWSVFRTDVGLEDWGRLTAIGEAAWPGYAVSFDGEPRVLDTPYATLKAAGLAEETARALGPDLAWGAPVRSLSRDGAVLEDGQTIPARVVIDGRGARATASLRLAFQKFVGLEFATARPHGLLRPVVMDAAVPQSDGFRFFYVLPLSPTRMLVEDTRYSDGPDLDAEDVARQVRRYALDRGWGTAADSPVREERGVLPVILGGNVGDYLAEASAEAACVGLRGLFCHPTTGYSLPDAVRIAELLTAAPLRSTEETRALLAAETQRLWKERAFYRLLNRMLFAAEPDQRRRIMARFYRLPQPLIERFYAGRSTTGDKLRILSGRPPLPLGRALGAAIGEPRHA